MKNFIFRSLTATALLLFSAVPALAMQLVPKKSGVSVVASATPDAKVIGALKESDKVESEGRVGMFWAIKFNGQKAFVKATEMQPATANSNVSKALKYNVNNKGEDGKGSRTRATAVMGIRGLDDAEDVTGGGGKPNEELTRKMEARQIDSAGVSEIERSVNEELEKKAAVAPAK